jgi:hypothetical protein
MALRRTLLKTQRNDVFREIENAGLDATEFEWEEQIGYERISRLGDSVELSISVLVHKPSKFFFAFYPGRGTFSPGEQMLTESQESMGAWRLQLANVSRWISCLNREI